MRGTMKNPFESEPPIDLEDVVSVPNDLDEIRNRIKILENALDRIANGGYTDIETPRAIARSVLKSGVKGLDL